MDVLHNVHWVQAFENYVGSQTVAIYLFAHQCPGILFYFFFINVMANGVLYKALLWFSFFGIGLFF